MSAASEICSNYKFIQIIKKFSLQGPKKKKGNGKSLIIIIDCVRESKAHHCVSISSKWIFENSWKNVELLIPESNNSIWKLKKKKKLQKAQEGN